jgi:hypothetical protein
MFEERTCFVVSARLMQWMTAPIRLMANQQLWQLSARSGIGDDLQQAQLRSFQRGRCSSGAFQLAEYALNMRPHSAWADGQLLRHGLVARSKADPAQYVALALGKEAGHRRGRQLGLVRSRLLQKRIDNVGVVASGGGLGHQQRTRGIFSKCIAPGTRGAQGSQRCGGRKDASFNGNARRLGLAVVTGAIWPSGAPCALRLPSRGRGVVAAHFNERRYRAEPALSPSVGSHQRMRSAR